MHNFRRAAKVTGVFLAVVLVLSVLLAELYLQGENFDFQDARERDAAAGELTVLVCGASYPLFGVDTAAVGGQLGESCYNLSGKLMTMKGCFALLEQELARNPVHTVLLEVNPDTVIRERAVEGPEGDLLTLGRLGSTKQRLAYLKTAFPLSEYPMVYYDLVSKGIEAAVHLLRGDYRTENQFIHLGFNPTRKQDTELPTDYKSIYHLHSLPERVDPQTVEELEAVIELVRAHGATPILFTMPQSTAFNCKYDNLDFFHSRYRAFAEEHGVTYINFNLLRNKPETLPDGDCFFDETHLNATGAEVFSRLFASALGDILHGSERAGEYYSSYRDMESDPAYRKLLQ